MDGRDIRHSSRMASRDPGDVYFDSAWQIAVGKGADLWNKLEY